MEEQCRHHICSKYALPMNSRILSIILPIYKVEDYLPACLDSIYNQGINEELFEVICVNDGSPDNSQEILLDCAGKHSNLIIIEHPVNLSVGKSRNDGLRVSNGQYIWFIDPDDRIAPGSIDKILNLCTTHKLDMLAFNFVRVFNNGKIRDHGAFYEDSSILSGEELIRSRFGKNFIYYLLGFCWQYIYNRKNLLENNIYFPEGCYHEDSAYACRALIHSKRVMSIADTIYLYRYNENSATLQLSKRKSGRQVFDNVFFSGDLVEQLGHEFESINPEYGKILLNYARDDYYNRVGIMYLPLPYREKREFAALVKKNKDLVADKKRQMTFFNRLFAVDHIPVISFLTVPAYKCLKAIKRAL